MNKIRFFEPPENGVVELLPFGKVPTYNIIHRVPLNGKPHWIYCAREIHCPICDALTGATRAIEFIEAQLDWVW